MPRFEVEDVDRDLVLITLANYADDYGVCWPSQATLAQDCRCSDPQAAVLRSRRSSSAAPDRLPRAAAHNGAQRSDVFVLIGFEGREGPASHDDHPSSPQLSS